VPTNSRKTAGDGEVTAAWADRRPATGALARRMRGPGPKTADASSQNRSNAGPNHSDGYRYLRGTRFLDISPPGGVSPTDTFLLVHGLGGSLEQWAEVGRRLSATARVVAVDIPGFGESAFSDRRFHLDRAVRILADITRQLGLTDATLVSHSVGFVVAGRLAGACPEAFRRVVLVSGSLIRASEIAQHPARALRHPRTGLFVALQFAAGAAPVPRSVLGLVARSRVLRELAFWPFTAHPARLSPGLLVETLANSGSRAVLDVARNAAALDFRGALESIRQPVTLIWGEDDPLIDDYDLGEIRKFVHVTAEGRLAECGHWPWVEQVSGLTSFLGGETFADGGAVVQTGGLRPV